MSNLPTAAPMLSQTADHAIRALLTLARHGAGRAMRVEEIAERTGAPRNYLGKTLNALVKEGLLRSARGPNGGFALVVPIESITVGRVADLFGEVRSSRRCLLGTGPCNREQPCAAHERWSTMLASARHPLDRTSLAELLPEMGADAPLSVKHPASTNLHDATTEPIESHGMRAAEKDMLLLATITPRPGAR